MVISSLTPHPKPTRRVRLRFTALGLARLVAVFGTVSIECLAFTLEGRFSFDAPQGWVPVTREQISTLAGKMQSFSHWSREIDWESVRAFYIPADAFTQEMPFVPSVNLVVGPTAIPAGEPTGQELERFGKAMEEEFRRNFGLAVTLDVWFLRVGGHPCLRFAGDYEIAEQRLRMQQSLCGSKFNTYILTFSYPVALKSEMEPQVEKCFASARVLEPAPEQRKKRDFFDPEAVIIALIVAVIAALVQLFRSQRAAQS